MKTDQIRRCEIPARTLPPCDLEWGHDGDMHGNGGDGFYAEWCIDEHRRRQADRKNGVLPPISTEAHATDVECPTCFAWVGWACEGSKYGYHAAGYHPERQAAAERRKVLTDRRPTEETP